ncbi:unnamed protein product [Camellia sinensis]
MNLQPLAAMEMMMLEQELNQSWSYLKTIDSYFDEVGFHGFEMDTDMGNCEFSSSFLSTTEDSSEVSASVPYISSANYDEPHSYPCGNEGFQALSPIQQCLINLEESGITSDENMAFDEVDGLICSWIGSESGPQSQELDKVIQIGPSSIDVESVHKPVFFPKEDMELDNQLSILHLLKACGEAMENQQKELVEVILKRLDEKACPKGIALQRLAYYLIRSLDQHLDYLTQEASKNSAAAFRAFYQIFPYGRFAHFTANMLILEAVPEDAEVIHVVDFDMGEGVQWPPLIEALGRQRQRAMRIISVKCEDSNGVNVHFEKAKALLFEHAFSSGLKLKVEEMDMEGLSTEMKNIKKKCGGREWLAFNCMVGLPHMGRQRSSRQVTEFLKIAQESINTGKKDRGIVTFGDGHGAEEETMMSEFHGFGSFFEGQLGHVTALLESMEWHMPVHLKEARIAMECLFVAPYVSSLACFEKFEEREWRGGLVPKMGLNALKMSKDVIAEAKELVREGDGAYWVRSEGEGENEVVLCFLGTPLVRVSSWN